MRRVVDHHPGDEHTWENRHPIAGLALPVNAGGPGESRLTYVVAAGLLSSASLDSNRLNADIFKPFQSPFHEPVVLEAEPPLPLLSIMSQHILESAEGPLPSNSYLEQLPRCSSSTVAMKPSMSR